MTSRSWRRLEGDRFSRIERGHLDEVSLASIRGGGERPLDGAGSILVPRWRGGTWIDSSMLAFGAARAGRSSFAERPEWQIAPEVSFAIYVERSVIDILAWHSRSADAPRDRAEDRHRLTCTSSSARSTRSVGSRGRSPAIAAGPSGATRRSSAWLIVAEGHTESAPCAGPRAMLRGALPLDGRSIDGWLDDPRDQWAHSLSGQMNTP